MKTRRQLERMAESAEKDRVAWQNRADLCQMRADICAGHRDEFRKMAEAMPEKPGTRPLSSISKKGTLGVPKMEAQSANRGAKVSMARTKSMWPFRRALHKRNYSLPEWARQQKGITVEAAKSWLKAPSGGGRPIPLVWAERIAKDFVDDETGLSEVPPVDASWPNGIR
jgi:hypothetical protein